jgi:hypothetical protein
MLKRIREVPSTATSMPFFSAYEKCGLEASGYLEEEYFIYGEAAIYGEGATGEPEPLYSGDYVDRVIVRRPSDDSRASGNVVVEILNPTARVDLDRMWVCAHRKFLRDGDVYVGLTSKPDVLPALLAEDRERYAELRWNDPRPDLRRSGPSELARFIPDPKCETGLFWDILADLVLLLRSERPDNPIRGYSPRRLFLTGWSQSACYLIRFVNSFSRRLSRELGRQIFDGYLSAGAVHSLGIPLNQNGYFDPPTPMLASLVLECPVPFVAVQTESENARFGGLECRRPDSDDPECRFRTYELAGGSHDTKYNCFDYYNAPADIKKRGFARRFEGREEGPNDYPYEPLFNAAYRNLFSWAACGLPPLRAEPIVVDPATRENLVDALGNARGGLRGPFVDYPLCRYRSWSTEKEGRNELLGHSCYFSSSTLKELYGSLDGYLALIEGDFRRRAAEGALLIEDLSSYLELASSRALEHGLK